MMIYSEFDGTFEEFIDVLDKEMKKEIKYLDSLDILPFLKQGITDDDLKAELREAYNDEYDGNDMFDAIDSGDFLNYIEKRFNAYFDYSGRYILTNNPQKGTRYDKDPVSDIPEME